MYLKRFVFVNWGNIPKDAATFEMGPVNLFSGASGSGKTTAADAIQTVMTAAKNNLFNYNPGQDETTQKGQGGKNVRTLASYVLGCDDGSYARPGRVDGYLAAVFAPTRGESSDAFTAMIACRASLDQAGPQPVAREEELRFFILPANELNESDLRTVEGGFISLDGVGKHLQRRFGPAAVEEYSSKKGYLCRFYGALRGLDRPLSEREANHAAKAFSRFMAYKPVGSINDFVATEVLEKKELGEAIRSISGMMKTISHMEQDAQRTQQAIDRLAACAGHNKSFIDGWIEANLLRYQQDKLRYLQDQQRYLKEKQKQQGLRHEHAQLQANYDSLEDKYQHCKEQLILQEARRMGHSMLQEKDACEAEIKKTQAVLVERATQLRQADRQLQDNQSAAAALVTALKADGALQQIEQLEHKPLLQQAQQVASQDEAEAFDYHDLLNRDWIDISPLEGIREQAEQLQIQHQGLVELLQGQQLRDHLFTLNHQQQQRREQALMRVKQFKREVEQLQHGQHIRYPQAVAEAVNALKEKLPESEPRVLCEYIEVNDPDWQAAIEGYLGGNRFGIIVAPEYEAEAIRLVRGLRGRSSAKVIQGSKARQDAERLALPKGSIIELMTFSHETARAYLEASYGNVLQVASAEELRHTRRGLTADGLGSGNYSMWRCDLADGDLVFGKAARERALQAKQAELLRLMEQAHQLDQNYDGLRRLLQQVEKIAPLVIGELVAEILQLQRRLVSAEEALQQLDLSEFNDLEQEVEGRRQELKSLESEREQLQQQLGRLDNQQQSCQKKLEALGIQQEETQIQVEKAEETLESLAQTWPDFSPEDVLEKIDDGLTRKSLESLEEATTAALGQLRQHLCQMADLLREHNLSCQSGDSIQWQLDPAAELDTELFETLCQLSQPVNTVLERLKDHELVKRKESLAGLRSKFNDVFVDHLCGVIYHAINEGKQVLDTLNNELRHHAFGNERETYRFDWRWVPEYKEYWDFFNELRKLPVGDGASLFDCGLSEKSKQVRDRLLAMLLDDDEQRAFRDLQRIADYRNYRNYEIYKQVPGKEEIPLSQYGTGSGGQLETPAYIIRAAAITSALQFNQPGSHLRMVLVDEAFSKMDEARSRAVLNYLSETLGLQVLFIMPSKASGPFMDMVSNQFVFAKAPTTEPNGQLKTRVFVDRKRCNEEQIRKLWDNHRKTIRQQASLDFMEEFIDEMEPA